MEQLLQNQNEGAATALAVTEHNKGVESNLETDVNKETKRMSEANNKEETKIERWTRKQSERDERRKLRKEEKSRKAVGADGAALTKPERGSSYSISGSRGQTGRGGE
jgi:hypothetical protein